jgi:arylsulfatase A-like enzyme
MKTIFKQSGLGSGLILLSFCSSLSARPAEKKKPVNLLFIITDQQRYDALSLAGNSILKTPNLDRLGRQGVWFKNAYTPCAVSGPARACILTGCTVEHTGVLTNEIAYNVNIPDLMPMPTFDELLSKNGYSCEYFGKWHVPLFHGKVYKNSITAAGRAQTEFGPGMERYYTSFLDKNVPKKELKKDELYDTFSKRPYRPTPLDKRYDLLKKGMPTDIKVIQPDLHGCLMIPPEYTITAMVAKETIAAINTYRDKPFSITCSFHFPHAPMLPPEPYFSAYPPALMKPSPSISDRMENSPYINANGRKQNPEYSDPEKIKYMMSEYYGLIKEIDDWTGEILTTLDELGLTENTMVIFTSDHGEMLGSHGMREKNVFYEESAHIPLMIRMPGRIKPGCVVDGYVSNIDLFATINDYLDLPEYPSDGQSLRGLIDGKDTGHGKLVVTEWLYNEDRAPAYMIVKDNWKMFIPFSEKSEVINALYNLKTDPFEMNNLIGNNPEKYKYENIVNGLRKDLIDWLKKNKSKHLDGVAARKLI